MSVNWLLFQTEVEEKSLIGPKMLIYCENQNFHPKKFLCIFVSLVTAGHWAESNVDRHWRFNLLWSPRKNKTDACSEASCT